MTMRAAGFAPARAIALPQFACPVSGNVTGSCPWLDMIEAGRSRMRGWLAAGSGTLAVLAACAGLALLNPPRPEPVVIPLTLAPEAAPRALALSAVTDPAPVIPEGAPQSLAAPETDPVPEPAMPVPSAVMPEPPAPPMQPPPMAAAPTDNLPALETTPPEVSTPAVSDTRPHPRPQVAPRQPTPAATQPARQQPAPAASRSASAAPPGQAGSAGAASARQQGQPAAPQVSAADWTAQVIARIRSVRQKRVRGTGSTTIGFSIAANGGLAAVSVLRSSGNAELDQAGLDHIRRAAPFPPPPAGAGGGLSFDFTAR